MSYRFLLSSLACVFSFVANAEVPLDSAVLYSNQKDQGVVWTNGKTMYYKSFKASLLNVGVKDIELSGLCYKAYDAKGNSYELDTIDEKLSQGFLKSGKTVQGFLSVCI
ncbi:DUF4354 family protein [Pseudomonas fluorescens]|uniref:DUF4354 family protein n=1 Tax=Pseudomonas fluorescens TaxID=294 RepID=UPI000A01B588|nr:DUF4354 family protein [Pseudomonas fluorescens]MCI4604634.1 DUF4354 family protein [Pseudomonas fluorescens]RFP94455.1 DUF4354 family protein [Pseudomonas fluorescens]